MYWIVDDGVADLPVVVKCDAETAYAFPDMFLGPFETEQEAVVAKKKFENQIVDRMLNFADALLELGISPDGKYPQPKKERQ